MAITSTHEVVNYPGGSKTSGKALTETLQRQAETFDIKFLLPDRQFTMCHRTIPVNLACVK